MNPNNTTLPTVSILRPCYNSQDFISETLDSCIKQTYSNIEVIVVDDGSTDNSYKIAKEFERDSRIHVYQQISSGACYARNRAFEKSSGDYVIFLDADDVINPSFVKSHIACLRQTNGNVSFGVWDRFHYSMNEAKFPYLKIYKNYDDAFQLLLDMWNNGDMLQTSCYMTPRQLVVQSGGWKENVLKNQDGEFFSRILMIAKKALFVPQAKVYYRTGEYLTVSKANNKRKVESLLDTFIYYRENALKHEDSRRVRVALSVNFTLFIYLYGNRYPDLYKRAKDEIMNLNVGYILKNEPYRVLLISRLVGFDNFMKLRRKFFNR